MGSGHSADDRRPGLNSRPVGRGLLPKRWIHQFRRPDLGVSDLSYSDHGRWLVRPGARRQEQARNRVKSGVNQLMQLLFLYIP